MAEQTLTVLCHGIGELAGDHIFGGDPFQQGADVGQGLHPDRPGPGQSQKKQDQRQ